MLARIRISVPDRPGSLGRVATAIGGAHADIAKVDVLEGQAGRALDDVFVQVRDGAHLRSVTSALGAVPGADVVGVQVPVPPVTGHTDLELCRQVLARPDRAVRTLVDGAPKALGADWAAVLGFGPTGIQQEVVAVSQGGPAAETVRVSAPLRLAAVDLADPGTDRRHAGCALVPLEPAPLGLLLVRADGVAFHRTELWRLAQVGSVLGVGLTVGS